MEAFWGVFWGVFFGVIAGMVLIWSVARVLRAERWGDREFTGSEPDVTHADLEEHLERWDRSRDED